MRQPRKNQQLGEFDIALALVLKALTSCAFALTGLSLTWSLASLSAFHFELANFVFFFT